MVSPMRRSTVSGRSPAPRSASSPRPPASNSPEGQAHNLRVASSPLRFGSSQGQNICSARAYNHMAESQLASAALTDIASMTIRLNRLPQDITTRDIYTSLTQQHLSIVRIEIFENENGVKTGGAIVNIEPVPSRWPPWSGQANVCTIHRRKSSPLRIPIEIQRTSRFEDTIKTPLNHVVPRQWTFHTRELLFGMMAKDDTMLRFPQYLYQGVAMTIRFNRRIIEITFKVDLGQSCGVRSFKIPIRFSHIKSFRRVKKQDGRFGLVIQLPSPPEIFSRAPDTAERSHDDGVSLWQERDSWLRQLEITHQLEKSKRACAQLQKEYVTVDIGRWTTYYLDVSRQLMSPLERFGSRLADYNVKLGQTSPFYLVEPDETNAWTLLNSAAPRSSWELLNSKSVHLPFEVRYQLEVCISQGLFNEYSIDAQFLEKLNAFDVDRARMMLEGVADHEIPYYKPMEIFEEPKILYYWPSVKMPPQSAMVRKAVVTPTGIIFKSPSVELTNRVLRQYSDLTDRFLRVQFTDELTFGKIWSDQGSAKSDELYYRVWRVLLNGIVVGDRHYKILAWSNSQFREHGAFFFCANDHVTCDDIREWMGDLTHIRSVGKFAARMGQCFTTTHQVRGISVPTITTINDISLRKDGEVWNFTDGVGKISPFIAAMITHEQNLIDTPSCFQFRMGGCKGVLVVWPDVPAKQVHIRPSQEKFKAPYNGLETIKFSTFSQATLNKQIIPILNCLGVDDQVFMDLLEEELKEYQEALTDATQASELLRQRVDENQISLTMAEMVDTFMDKNEPFLWTLLRLWKCWALQRLKHKAAISVKKSAFLYGCVDELGILRGHSRETERKGDLDVKSLPQIFLQVPREGADPNNTMNYRVITGLCVVGRNPSLHPGDVRVVEAVDVPGLRHLKNVVVFPKTGDRDIPSMCSGGDLDGDDFFVVWDERLLPKEWDFPPMDHDADSATPGLDGSVDITIDHMCDFFTQYMKNDSLGLIATAHVAWTDKVGPKHPKCIELAKLHSKAVDYIKSGRPATMHKSLNPKAFPHFMERERKSYISNKPVGRIYTRVSVEKFSPAYNMPFDERILTRFELSKEELDRAREVKAKYDVAMRRLMGQHERPISEFEIWSTFILSKPRVGNEYKLAETVGREVSALKNRFRTACGEAVTGVAQKSDFFSYSSIDLEKLDRFVAAMYTVTHDEVQKALGEQSMPVIDEEGNKIADDQGPGYQMPLISFPWLFHKELARVASGRKPVTRKWKDFGVAKDDGGKAAQPQSVVDDTNVLEQKEGARKAVESRTQDRVGRDVEHEEEQRVSGKKEGASAGADGDGDGDCVRTASGKMIKRGEILVLFDDSSDAMEMEMEGRRASSTQEAPSAFEPSRDPISQLVESESHNNNDNTIAAKEDENEDKDEDEFEDPLEELAKIIAGK